MNPSEQINVYEFVGGAETFQRLVDEFYSRVEQDPLLRTMFPADLEPGKKHQLLFLIQYFGGPRDYNELRGHPRLRMRHAPFPIGQAARDAWLGHMLAAVDVVGIAEPARSLMHEYFANAATAMMNELPPLHVL
ncbi:globin [Candidatus Gracilibacteria bacterium]|nr:globin [Candidatus Gracilibacteria bacterium]